MTSAFDEMWDGGKFDTSDIDRVRKLEAELTRLRAIEQAAREFVKNAVVMPGGLTSEIYQKLCELLEAHK